MLSAAYRRNLTIPPSRAPTSDRGNVAAHGEGLHRHAVVRLSGLHPWLATESGCPKADALFLDEKTFTDQKQNWTHHFSFGDITRLGWENLFGDKLGVLYEIVLGDAARCYHGD